MSHDYTFPHSTMKKATTLFLALTASLLIGAIAQIYEPIRWHVEQKATGEGTADLYLRASIDEGWHLYGLQLPEGGPLATSIVFTEVKNAQLVGEMKPLSELHYEYDANFDMELNWYTGEAVFVQSIAFDQADAVRIEGHVEYMACNDQTCLPPAEAPFAIGHAPAGEADHPSAPDATAQPAAAQTATPLPLSPATLPMTAIPADAAGNGTPDTPLKYWTPVVDELQALGESRADDFSLGWIFLVGMLGGLLALVTPCVWPIIPMTVSFFLKRAQDKARGRRDAVLYGVASTGVSTIVIDKILYGAGAGTLAIIITEKGRQIGEKIGEKVKRGVTTIPASGGYTGMYRDVILCACSKAEAYLVKSIVQEVDDKAFVMFTETSEVLGEGFKTENKQAG